MKHWQSPAFVALDNCDDHALRRACIEALRAGKPMPLPRSRGEVRIGSTLNGDWAPPRPRRNANNHQRVDA